MGGLDISSVLCCVRRGLPWGMCVVAVGMTSRAAAGASQGMRSEAPSAVPQDPTQSEGEHARRAHMPLKPLQSHSIVTCTHLEDVFRCGAKVDT